MKQAKKPKWIKFLIEITLCLWIIIITTSWIILSTYENTEISKFVPVAVKEKIKIASESIYKYVWHQYKYAEK